MTDFTIQLEDANTATSDVAGDALETVVESATDNVESAVDAVDAVGVIDDVVAESVDTGFPVENMPKTDDPYTEALQALEAQQAHDAFHAEVGVANHADSKPPQLQTDSYSSQLFWLAATFILLYLLMARSVLPRIHEVLEKRRHRIEHDLDQAERLAQEADESKADYERMQAESVARSQQMIADTESAIRTASDEEHEKLDAELAERLAEADKAIAKAAADVKKKLKPTAESVAQEIVKAMTGSQAADKKVADVVAKVKW